MVGRTISHYLQAYDYYLRARSYTRQLSLEFAMQMFDQAIALDPSFALAYAGLAKACGQYHEWREQHPRWIEKGLQACERGMALQPHLPELQVARARIAYAQQKNEEAIRYAEHALELKPNCEGAYDVLGRALFATGRLHDAAALVERAVAANGDDYNAYISYMNVLHALKKDSEVAVLRGQWMRTLERQLEQVPEDVRARQFLAVIHADLGHNAEAERELEIAVTLRPRDSTILYNAACLYGILQRKDKALAMLRRAKDAGYGNVEWAAKDPDLACLRDDPEFQQLVGKPS